MARLGRLVDDSADADVAVLRLAAPFEPRPGRLESMFHAGSLAFAPAERDRLLAVCAAVPTVVDLYLDRPAVVPEPAGASSVEAVEASRSDVPFDTADPLFRFGEGLQD